MFMTAWTARRSSSSVASTQPGQWLSASSSVYGNPSFAASRRANVVLPLPLTPTTAIFLLIRGDLPDAEDVRPAFV
jgi:hypothetical protein